MNKFYMVTTMEVYTFALLCGFLGAFIAVALS